MPLDFPPPPAPTKPAGTHFAPAERLDDTHLQEELRAVGGHPLLDTLLIATGSLLAVLNEHRQILALNERLLAFLGLGSAETVLGLRLGEALACPHSEEMAGGCGTSRFCRTCGAAIAQVAALEHRQTAERICCLEVTHAGVPSDLFLRVRVTPFAIEDRQLLLLFIEDITQQQQAALIERAFQHDLANTLASLLGASEMLIADTRTSQATDAVEVHRLVRRVVREIDLQRKLASANHAELRAAARPLRLGTLGAELRDVLVHHPSSTGKRTVFRFTAEDFEFVSDATLLLRVLGNMAINALEATPVGGEIQIQCDPGPGGIDFAVWNQTPIPPEVALRIFQRNFSTKGTFGRGLGTFSMKLIGERLLGGRVSFDSAPGAGTTFRFRLPL